MTFNPNHVLNYNIYVLVVVVAIFSKAVNIL